LPCRLELLHVVWLELEKVGDSNLIEKGGNMVSGVFNG